MLAQVIEFDLSVSNLQCFTQLFFFYNLWAIVLKNLQPVNSGHLKTGVLTMQSEKLDK